MKAKKKHIDIGTLRDCLVKAYLISRPLPAEYFKGGPPATKFELGCWSEDDLQELNRQNIDPSVVLHNFTVEASKVL